MKKQNLFYGLLALFIIFSSCSKDDDSNSNSIVGIWKPIKEIDVCSNGSEEKIDYDSCEQTGRFVFEKSGSFSKIDNYLNNNGDCELDESYNGTWTLSDGDLSLNFGGLSLPAAYFELSGNTLRIGQYDDSWSCQDGSSVSYYYTEYIKVTE
ncbi:MAG TPA: lipocalin family protein [Arenibacter sp.]|nr:lipocalin family protein [Arenibacter sp.]